MATKTAKKATTAKKTVAKKTTKGKGIIYEKYPDEHKVTGKYKIFYILFATTTIIFAILAAVLYVTCIDLFNKYDSVQSCARNHGTCTIKYFDAEGNEVTPDKATQEDAVSE